MSRSIVRSTNRTVANRLSRRGFIARMSGLGAGVALFSIGCSSYPAEDGDAYEPWHFPGDERDPARLAVAAATLAASPHNTQPWAFRIDSDRIDVFADFSRTLGAMDPSLRELHIGLGCALENLVLAARANGRASTVSYLPDPADPTLVARVEFDTTDATPDPAVVERYAALPQRHTNRGRYLDAAPPAGLEDALRALIDDADVRLTFLGTSAAKARFRDETIAATRAILGDEEMLRDSDAWYRHTADDIRRHRDGTTIDATGLGATTRQFGKGLARPSAKESGEYWLDSTIGRQTSASAFVILSTRDRDARAQQLRVGQVYQRMHLWGTHAGLGMQALNQLAERQDREQQLGLEPRFGNALAELLERPESDAQMLFRVGYPWDDAFQSPRRPLDDVLV